MNTIMQSAAELPRLCGKVGRLYTRRLQDAHARFTERFPGTASMPHHRAAPGDLLRDWTSYTTDAAQRSLLFWDTIRRRGNQYLEHEHAGKPPVLVFDYEMVLDGRGLERPVNYALVRI